MATYYNPSDYGDKYYKGFTDERGIEVGLSIKQRGYSGRKYRIGRLQGLNFQIQGNDEVTAPIVKTNLQITLLDDIYYPDSDGQGLYYDGSQWYRVGDWREFYTPDSTKYLVELSYDTVPIWRGYITPDSYTESLDSYGSVVITARDNIGHLQDFDFDMGGDSNGLVKVTDLITQAFTKIAFPMDLTTEGFDTSDDRYLLSEDGNYCLGDLYFNAAALEGKTYYDALEDILNSLGFCLRFADGATFYLTPLRAMPYCGYDESTASAEQPLQRLQFYGRGSGTRTFDPAYKQIVENVNFEQEDEFTPEILFAKTGTKTVGTDSFISYFGPQEVTTPYGQTVTQETASSSKSPIVAGSTFPSDYHGWSDIPLTYILDDESYSLQEATEELEGESMHDYLFLAANVGTLDISGTTIKYSWTRLNHRFVRKVRSTQLKVTFNFAAHPAGFDSSQKLGVYPSLNLAKVEYYVSYKNSAGETRYWGGEYWQTTEKDITLEFDALNTETSSVEISLLECDELGANGTLSICITKIIYQSVGYFYTYSRGSYVLNWYCPSGVYARLKSVTFSSSATKRMKSDTVTTICNAAYNVRCDRNPFFGFVPTSVNFVNSINYKNAFFVYDSNSNAQLAPYKWRWNTDQSVLPFPVRIHQQLLMYHYTTEEVLEGDCGLIKGSLGYGSMSFDVKNFYKSKKYLLKSCTFDLIKGRFTTAELRSFKYYTDLWNGDETYNDDKIS